MAYAVTKNPDGDVSLGSLNGEVVTLQPAAADYATGGYAIISGVQAVNTPTLASSVNCDLYRIIGVIPIGGYGGYHLAWNPTTQTLQVFQQSAATGPLTQVPAATDLSAYAFQLLLIGQ
jgi:hypothetical protein